MWYAIERAHFPTADYRVYNTLLKRADFRTTEIPERFQFRSVVKLAEFCEVSPAAARRSIAHLERHGWLKHDPGNGRGHRTIYTLLVGEPCDCKGAHTEHLSARKGAQDQRIKVLKPERVSAGEPADCAGMAVKGEVVEWGSAEGWRIPWELAAHHACHITGFG